MAKRKNLAIIPSTIKKFIFLFRQRKLKYIRRDVYTAF